jgi:hypothetical protein
MVSAYGSHLHLKDMVGPDIFTSNNTKKTKNFMTHKLLLQIRLRIFPQKFDFFQNHIPRFAPFFTTTYMAAEFFRRYCNVKSFKKTDFLFGENAVLFQ